jgi:protein-disulfide isomerase
MSEGPSIGSAPRREHLRAALDVLATVVMMMAAVAIIWNALGRQGQQASAQPSLPVPATPLDLEFVPALGSARARVAMLIFSDFECPFCARLAVEVMPALKREYVDSERVIFAFRHLPLPAHTRAARAAESAECARRQGRFWAMHDSLFQLPMRLDEAAIQSHARAARLDLGEFATCMNGAASERVATDAAIARDLGLMATPTVVIGVLGEDGDISALEVVRGARPLKEFRKALDRALASVVKH